MVELLLERVNWLPKSSDVTWLHNFVQEYWKDQDCKSNSQLVEDRKYFLGQQFLLHRISFDLGTERLFRIRGFA